MSGNVREETYQSRTNIYCGGWRFGEEGLKGV
jgi:hypothetical protein